MSVKLANLKVGRPSGNASTEAIKPVSQSKAAEIRMANEVDAAQERGEVARREDNLLRGPDDRSSDIGKATLSDLGIDRRHVSDWRRVRDAGPASKTLPVDDGRIGRNVIESR